MISGYLFFFNINEFNYNVYRHKLKSRFRTLLLPYVIWNIITIIIYLLSENFIGDLTSGNKKPISEYSILDYFLAFWDTSITNPDTDPFPIDYPLWYIRDLMLLICFTPLIYLLVKKLKTIPVIILGILWVTNYWISIPGLSIMGFFFFSAGAYLSIFKTKLIDLGNVLPNLGGGCILYGALIAAELLSIGSVLNQYIHKLGIILGIIVAIKISIYLVSKKRITTNGFISNSTFILFAYHALPLAFFIKILIKFFSPHTDFQFVLLYFINPLITIVLGLLIYYCLKKITPKLTALITGGR